MSNMQFGLEMYGDVKPYSKTLSLARVRIFYKGSNRNATFITEEFAELLLSTLSYTPVKGIYSEDTNDYTNHGKKRTEGRVYGVVPHDPNLKWEDHEDEDGVIRTYACADCLLFTALYPEALQILNKPQSMEIYAQSIKGEWKTIEGKRQFVYTDGCFLGLQVLGDDTEPCFEGAEFFSLYTNLKNLIDELEGGKEDMYNFKLSDSAKHRALFSAINPNYSEEGKWEVKYGINEVYDEYALCYDYETQTFCRCYYQKDSEQDSITVDRFEACFIVDVSESENNALSLLKTANSGSFERVDEVFTAANGKIEDLTTELGQVKTEYEAKVQELETATGELSTKDETIATLNATIEAKTGELNSLTETSTATIAEKTTAIEQLTGELSSLKAYRDEIEGAQKQAVIATYSEILDEETLKPVTDNLATYSVLDLKKELAFIASEKNPSIFTKTPGNDSGYIPTGSGTENLSGATKILMKHRKS